MENGSDLVGKITHRPMFQNTTMVTFSNTGYRSLNAFHTKAGNTEYAKAMMVRFGTNPAKDNYKHNMMLKLYPGVVWPGLPPPPLKKFNPGPFKIKL